MIKKYIYMTLLIWTFTVSMVACGSVDEAIPSRDVSSTEKSDSKTDENKNEIFEEQKDPGNNSEGNSVNHTKDSAEEDSTGYAEPGDEAYIKDEAYSEAYKAYARELMKDKEAILGYNWQNDTLDDTAPSYRNIVLCDVFGDDTPELIYIPIDDGDSSYTDFRVFTYENGKARKLYDSYWDTQVGGVFYYKIFSVNDEKNIYYHSVFECDYTEETYAKIAFKNDGYMYFESLFSHKIMPDYDNIVDGTLGYYDQYFLGDNEISKEEYQAMEQELKDRAKDVLLYSDYPYDENILDSVIKEGHYMAMTYDEAIGYLEVVTGENYHENNSSSDTASESNRYKLWDAKFVCENGNTIEVYDVNEKEIHFKFKVLDAMGESFVTNDYSANFDDEYCRSFRIPYQSGINEIFAIDGSDDSYGVSVYLDNGMAGANDGFYDKVADNNGSGESANTGSENSKEPYTGIGIWNSGLFEVPSTRFNLDLALVAAYMSYAAEDMTGDNINQLYRELNLKDLSKIYSIKGIFKEYNLDSAVSAAQDVLTINGKDTNVLIITTRGTMTVSEGIGDLFKGGTDQICGQNAFDNVYDYEEIVWEFLESYLNLYPELKETDNLKILVNGHSLGGAAANLIGARIDYEIDHGTFFNKNISKDDVYVYTFGAIKVLDREDNVGEGYENIHNIYNLFDSFGPWGSKAFLNVSSPYAKFGHTELFSIKHLDIGVTNTDSHNMTTYIDALEREKVTGIFIRFLCPRSGGGGGW